MMNYDVLLAASLFNLINNWCDNRLIIISLLQHTKSFVWFVVVATSRYRGKVAAFATEHIGGWSHSEEYGKTYLIVVEHLALATYLWGIIECSQGQQ